MVSPSRVTVEFNLLKLMQPPARKNRRNSRPSQSRVVTAAFSFRQFRVRSTSPRTEAIEGNFIADGRIEQWAE
ncbi:MAG: hypothetical protein CMJ77_16370 [Planctomycetaceae bacterium]|nr:hypothetical protein [Planctomycetaceae bacterium]